MCHFSSYTYKGQLSSYIGQVIEDKSYILLRCHVINDGPFDCQIYQ